MSDQPKPTLAAREERRQHHRQHALDRAALAEVTMSCQLGHGPGDTTEHPTCVGLTAAGPTGCLCRCHDYRAAEHPIDPNKPMLWRWIARGHALYQVIQGPNMGPPGWDREEPRPEGTARQWSQDGVQWHTG